MLNLIYGPSGSGKSEQLTGMIRRDIRNGTQCYLLVPEQEAYIRERDLPGTLPENAGLYFEVVHFSGLCDAVFRRFGGVTHLTANSGARSLLMWETLRTLSPLLTQYRKSARSDIGLVDAMLSEVDELKNNGISSDQLEDAAGNLPEESPLKKKISDLALVCAAYQGKMNEAFGGMPADRLERAAEFLRGNGFFSGCNVYIDSFTSFTAPEMAVIREILRQAKEVSVALCADRPDNGGIHFSGIRETGKRLTRLAKKLDIPVETRILSAPDTGKPESLLLIGRELWNLGDPGAKPDHDGTGTVHLLTCPNLYDESEAAALNILGLAQSGMHYGDIAVIVRDTEVYRGILDAALERHGIPYFLSERTDLSSKPLARLILSALRAVGRNYPAQDVITLVKTGLCGADAREASLFEEYCETWHISGARFCDDVWSMNPDGLTAKWSDRAKEIAEVANRVRASVMLPLQRFAAELRGSDLLKDRCSAVYAYLSRLKIPEIMADYAEKELALGQTREAGETVRLYRFVTETLVNLYELLPESRVTVDEFLSMLTILFSRSDLGSVPNVHDCVTIGSAATVRVENVRASLLLGLCEGEFPRSVEDKGLLTDGDKLSLEEFGIVFDGKRETRSREELFYVYRAMTKPREQLFLSYPSAQNDGSERNPSLAFTRVRYLLGREADTFRTEDLVLQKENETPPVYPFRAVPYPSGTRLSLSNSSIRQFLLCPYQYYSTHRLHLREKKDSRTTYADDGIFLHFIFERFLRSSLTGDGQLIAPEGEELDRAVDQAVAEYLDEVCPVPPEELDSRLLHLFGRLRELSRIMLRSIVAELKVSRFRPAAFEQTIGGKDPDDLPEVLLKLEDGSSVRLGGTIDRVDVFRTDDAVYLRVVDYKSGNHVFDLKQVASGMDIQLILYLFAVANAGEQKNERVIPAGAEFFYAAREKGKISIGRSGFICDDPEILSAADGTEDQIYLKKLIRQTEDEIRKLTEGMQETVCSVATRILSGEADKTPSEDACKFCPIRPNCGVAADVRER